MAGPREDPVLEIDDISEHDKAGLNNNIKQPVDKAISLAGGEREMAPPVGNSIHRSSSRPQLDLSKAAIQGSSEERDPTILLPNQSDDISHLALDIGGITCVFIFVRLTIP